MQKEAFGKAGRPKQRGHETYDTVVTTPHPSWRTESFWLRVQPGHRKVCLVVVMSPHDMELEGNMWVRGRPPRRKQNF